MTIYKRQINEKETFSRGSVRGTALYINASSSSSVRNSSGYTNSSSSYVSNSSGSADYGVEFLEHIPR